MSTRAASAAAVRTLCTASSACAVSALQNEKPDPWLTAHSWAEKTDVTYPVELAGKEYTARLYKLAVTGYEGRRNSRSCRNAFPTSRRA